MTTSLLTREQLAVTGQKLPADYLKRGSEFVRRMRRFLTENGYATRYSLGYYSMEQLSDMPRVLGGQRSGCLGVLDTGGLMSTVVSRVDVQATLPVGSRFHGQFRYVAVYSMCELSNEVALQCVVCDIMRLSPGDRDQVVVIGNGVKPTQRVTALPSPVLAPLPEPLADEQDPALNDIVARHARASYFDRIDYLISKALEDQASAPVASNLNAALVLLRDLAPLAI